MIWIGLLGRWTWRDTSLLSWFGTGICFSVHRFLPAGKHAGGWYVSFERPRRRTRIGIDTCDLFAGLVVQSDLSGYAWKDEGEYAQARRLGLIDDAVHAAVDEARQHVLALIESRGPIARDLSAWRPDPHWAAPVLPDDAPAVPASL